MATKKRVSSTPASRGKGSNGSAAGGPRKGAGRKSLYDDKLDKKIPTRLSEEQGKGIIAFCQAKRINPNNYLREASLEVAGAPKKLRKGLEASFNTLGEGKVLPVPGENGIQMPVKYTVAQFDFIEAYCGKKGIEKGTFVKDAGLIKANLARMTTAEQHREQAERLTSATL